MGNAARQPDVLPERREAPDRDDDVRLSGIRPLAAAARELDQRPQASPRWLEFAKSVPGLVLSLGLVYMALAYAIPILVQLAGD